MPKYGPDDIRNVVFAGHGSSGKTTLVEAILLQAKVVARLGSVKERTSYLDSDPEEKERQHSIFTKVASFTLVGRQFNLEDTPGYPDFIGEVIPALAAADGVVVAVDASAGVKVNTRKVWSLAAARSLPRVIVVTRLDLDQANWETAVLSIQESFGNRAIPIYVPDASGPAIKKVVQVLGNSSSDYHDKLIEAVVEADEALLTRYLEGETLSPEEITKAMVAGVAGGTFFPIIPVAAEKGIGVAEVIDAMDRYLPRASLRRSQATDSDGKEVPLSPEGPFVAQFLKTIVDPYVGKLSIFRVHGGMLKVGQSVENARTGETIRVGNIYRMKGKDQETVDAAIAGDILAISKADDVEVGDTLTEPGKKLTMKRTDFPTPMVSYAVEPKTRGDEQKMSAGLRKIASTDPTFKYAYRPDTRELVISGMSTLHLDIMLARLKKQQGIEVETRLPKTPYRETILGTAAARHRHKKQSGGAGEFGEVELKVEPLPRGSGFEYVDGVVGGVIPNQFIPSVEKGIRSVLDRGVVAGYPVVDVRATVYDGKTHPVDGKDSAFQKAGREAFKQAFEKAKPVLLEPIVEMEIQVPVSFMGQIMGDLTGRRGQIVGTDNVGNYSVVKAKIPQAEIPTYSTELRSLTGGEGSYTTTFSHYDVVPSHIAQAVMAQSKTSQESEE